LTITILNIKNTYQKSKIKRKEEDKIYNFYKYHNGYIGYKSENSWWSWGAKLDHPRGGWD